MAEDRNCTFCGAEISEMYRELTSQEDMYGAESMTEAEQYFISQYCKKDVMCVDCIEIQR